MPHAVGDGQGVTKRPPGREVSARMRTTMRQASFQAPRLCSRQSRRTALLTALASGGRDQAEMNKSKSAGRQPEPRPRSRKGDSSAGEGAGRFERSGRPVKAWRVWGSQSSGSLDKERSRRSKGLGQRVPGTSKGPCPWNGQGGT